MGAVYELLKIVSILAFSFYGLRGLFANAMAAEFERYGLERFRRLTGVLEVLGAAGLAAGYFLPGLVVVASGGLTLLMALGVGVRLRSGDSVGQAMQALAMFAVNLFIFVYALRFAGH